MSKLTPIQRAYIRKKARPVELDPSEMQGELNIVPFLDIVMNLIMFLLATSEAVLLISQIESNPPKISRGGRPSNEPVTTPLNLNVTVTSKGVIVTGSGGKLAKGCDGTEVGSGITVPSKKKGEYKWAELTKCVAKVKSNFEDEDTVIVSADPQIEYEHIIAAMDAVRNEGDEELFPKVLISVGVR